MLPGSRRYACGGWRAYPGAAHGPRGPLATNDSSALQKDVNGLSKRKFKLTLLKMGSHYNFLKMWVALARARVRAQHAIKRAIARFLAQKKAVRCVAHVRARVCAQSAIKRAFARFLAQKTVTADAKAEADTKASTKADAKKARKAKAKADAKKAGAKQADARNSPREKARWKALCPPSWKAHYTWSPSEGVFLPNSPATPAKKMEKGREREV